MHVSLLLTEASNGVPTDIFALSALSCVTYGSLDLLVLVTILYVPQINAVVDKYRDSVTSVSY